MPVGSLHPLWLSVRQSALSVAAPPSAPPSPPTLPSLTRAVRSGCRGPSLPAASSPGASRGSPDPDCGRPWDRPPASPPRLPLPVVCYNAVGSPLLDDPPPRGCGGVPPCIWFLILVTVAVTACIGRQSLAGSSRPTCLSRPPPPPPAALNLRCRPAARTDPGLCPAGMGRLLLPPPERLAFAENGSGSPRSS